MSYGGERTIMLDNVLQGEAGLKRRGTNLKDNYIISLIKLELCEDERQTKGQSIRRKDIWQNFPDR